MAEGKAEDIEVLNGLDVYDFFNRLVIWEKKKAAEIDNYQRRITPTNRSRR